MIKLFPKGMKNMINKIKELAFSLGVCDIGFAECQPISEYEGLQNSITIVIKLSDAVIDAIDQAPTHTNSHRYPFRAKRLSLCSCCSFSIHQWNKRTYLSQNASFKSRPWLYW